MPSTPTQRLRVMQQAKGEGLSVWGDPNLNDALSRLEEAIAGVASITLSAVTYSLNTQNYVADEARMAVLVFAGAPTAAVTVTTPAVQKGYLVVNKTAQNVILTTGTGTTAICRPGVPTAFYCDAVNWLAQDPTLDQIKTATASLNLGGNKITNQGAGTAATDGATLSNRLDQFAVPQANLSLNAFKITGSANASLGTDLIPYAQVVSLIASATVNMPAQTGNAGRFLTTDGTSPSWNTSPLAIVNGGTGATTATLARAALLPAYTGNALKALRVNAAANDVEYANVASGLVLLSSQTVGTAVAAVDFTSGIDATYDEYEIHFQNVVPVADAQAFYALTSANAGGAFDSGASIYSGGGYQRDTSSAGTTVGSLTFNTNIALSATSTSTVSKGGLCGRFNLFRPSVAQFNHFAFEVVGSDANGFRFTLGFGNRANAAIINAVRFMFASGSIASGVFRLYGVQKA